MSILNAIFRTFRVKLTNMREFHKIDTEFLMPCYSYYLRLQRVDYWHE